MADTIYALSSGSVPSGIAIIRISGPQTRFVLETMCANKLFVRGISLSDIFDPSNGLTIDSGLVAIFPEPNSFTGEDILEFQVHGGRAVVDKIFDSLSTLDGLRHADAGEFTYRAFENGMLDLTQAEGIADLIASETENQRQLALANLAGESKNIIEKWSEDLLSMRALIEAEIDFVDEDDIPGSVSEQVWEQGALLLAEMDRYLDRVNCGEIVREGFKVALLGRPNSGKSTLLNALADRDVAIVTDEPGTTRDVLNVLLDLDGQAVIVFDTAGIRDTENKIEIEGIRRSISAAQDSHLTLWLKSVDDESDDQNILNAADFTVFTKSDLINDENPDQDEGIFISAKTGNGLDELTKFISLQASKLTDVSNPSLFSSKRQRSQLVISREKLSGAVGGSSLPIEIRSELLRVSGDSLGAITGKVDVEDLLGVIFSKFCVGK